VLVGSGGEPGAGALTAVPLAPLLPLAEGGQPSSPHSPADFLLDRPRQADPGSDIQFPSHPESFQLDRAARRIYVNLPDEHEIAVLTLGSNGLSVATTWPVTAGEKNFPMALDAASNRLFIATRKPPRLVVYDTQSGRALSQTPCVGDADDLFSPSRKRLKPRIADPHAHGASCPHRSANPGIGLAGYCRSTLDQCHSRYPPLPNQTVNSPQFWLPLRDE
jgi:hypothetical protein